MRKPTGAALSKKISQFFNRRSRTAPDNWKGRENFMSSWKRQARRIKNLERRRNISRVKRKCYNIVKTTIKRNANS